jgi:tetratricopeptide (TPR) repeat protein
MIARGGMGRRRYGAPFRWGAISAARAAACVLATVAWASTARAADDGGTRSIFAAGAGTRALAMGGAFVGVADDASAMIWNPAGLGVRERLELQATHAGYSDLGSQQDLVAVVLPNWRWGAAGLSILHSSIGGIERRDDRNIVLGNDLSDSQTEIALGFGRSLNDALSIGGTVKIQRQSLAGFSGSGLGMDAGVLVSPGALFHSDAGWVNRMSWGLSIRNLVPPSIRLDQESVPDPAVVRSGIGFRAPAPGGRSALVVLDLEKSAGVATRVHAGMEFQVHPVLGLRAGFNSGRFSAGTGVAWRSFTVDYTYEDADVAGVHRFGVSRALGLTVAEQRDAASQAMEKDLQARLDEAFQKRQAKQVEDLLARVKAAEARAEYESAMDLLATVDLLYPGHPQVPALQAAALSGRGKQLEESADYAAAALAYGRALAIAPDDSAAAAGQQRCREAGDRRAARTESLRRQFAAASDAFAADSLRKARIGFAAILAVDPNDADAGVMLRRTEQAISRRTAGLIKQARQSIEAQLFDEADGLLADARKLDPQADGLREAASALARASASAVGTAVAKVDKPPPSANQDRELEALYRGGQTAMQERRLDDALRYWELVWSIRPGYKRVDEYLKREYLMRGMEFFASGKLEEAVACWQRVLQVDPKDSRAASYIARARTQLARTREILGEGR